MWNLKISTAQFENKSSDKEYNLSVIDKLSQKTASEGLQVIVFHECFITGYTFAKNLSKEDMLDIAEYISEGGSISKLKNIASKHNNVIFAGLFEKDHIIGKSHHAEQIFIKTKFITHNYQLI